MLHLRPLAESGRMTMFAFDPGGNLRIGLEVPLRTVGHTNTDMIKQAIALADEVGRSPRTRTRWTCCPPEVHGSPGRKTGIDVGPSRVRDRCPRSEHRRPHRTRCRKHLGVLPGEAVSGHSFHEVQAV
ncbi:hypothetical protein ACIBQ0_31960 [Nocardia nova]